MTALTGIMSPDSFATFGDLLRYLRRRARLTQLELSIAVGYSEGQISRLEKNQRLPDLTALKALFIPALHIEQEPELAARLLALAESARQEDAPAPGFVPYKGLEYFDEQDADWFFGRESLTAHLVDRVKQLTESPLRLLAIVGASGSGKSSVVRAGLAVTLKRAGWQTRIFTPTAQPVQALATVNRRPPSDVASHRIDIIDQFEEVFTLCRDESARATFIERLIALANRSDEPTTIAVVLRADFYSHCAQYPELRQAIAAQQEYIGQMTREELRRAIEEPAKRSNWEFEPGLVELMLSDVGAGSAQDQEPGALPLLSHALLATWERRRGRTLTLEGYRAAGGVRGAIAETAESVFTDQLNEPQQQLARAIFLRLTELGEGTEDTRRRAALAELVPSEKEVIHVRAVLNTLADARLVSLGEDSAEVAHEALIREWQRLREWLNQDRESLRLHRQLIQAAREWDSLHRDPGALYRGARLAQALEWREGNEVASNHLERAFLDASAEQEQKEQKEKEAQRQRELQATQKLAQEQKERAEEQARTAKQLRRRSYFLVGALILAMGLALLALFFSLQARKQERIATVRELAASANNNLAVDPERSILLALQAVNATQQDQTVLTEAQEALHHAVQTSRVQLTLRGHTGTVLSVAFSPDDQHLLTTSQDGTTRLWDATTGQDLGMLAGHTGAINSGTYSPDGTRIATAGADGTVKIWDAASRKMLSSWNAHAGVEAGSTAPNGVSALAYSPDGRRLATAGADKKAQVWNALTGQLLLTLAENNDGLTAICFNRDGTLIATGSNDGILKIWDASTGKELQRWQGHLSVNGWVSALAFSPDGKQLASSSVDATAKVWDPQTGRLAFNLFGHPSVVQAIAYNPEGTRLVTAEGDGTARLWDSTTGQLLVTLAGNMNIVQAVVFSHDGNRVATASRDNTAKVWDVSPEAGKEWATLVGHSARVYALAVSPDGKRIATGSVDETAKIWDAQTGQPLLTIPNLKGGVWGVAYSPDGTRLATQGEQDVSVWDAATGTHLLTIHNDEIAANGIAYSPDGRRLAAGVRVWDAQTGQVLLTLTDQTAYVQGIAFSPDGKHLATGSEDKTARIWDASGKLGLKLAHPSAVLRIAYSPDGKVLATAGGDGAVRLWDTDTGKLLQTLRGHSTVVFGVAFSPDRKQLASSDIDGIVKVWNITRLDSIPEPLNLYGNRAVVYNIAFTPDGARLVTASRDQTARIYALKTQDLVQIARMRVTRALTLEECQKYLHMGQCPP